MVDFRRLIPALAVLALLVVGLVPAANAQAPFSCLASAVPTALRSQGLTELTGDIVLDCTGGVNLGSGVIPTANIQVYLNTTVTSRLLSGNTSEALLLIDDPADNGSQTLGVNVFQGTVSGNSVQFLGVPINPPGTPGTHRIYRITNIRANASAIAQNSNVYALVIATGSTSLPIQNSPQLLVGNVQNGLTFTLLDTDASTTASGAFTIKQCEGADNVFANIIRFTEPNNFASSFKTIGGVQNVPGAIYNTESGLTTSVVPGAGHADTGTRLKAVFSNIPAGISVYVSLYNLNDDVQTTGVLEAHAVAGEIGSSAILAASDTFNGTDVVNVPVVNGTATAVWEVDAADPLSAQNFDFGIYYAATSDPGNNLPGVGAATVLGSFAPTPPAFDATKGASAQAASGYPIPRFAVTTASPIPVVSVAVCSTNLLFPFVTNTNGFDTGLAIANTSMDPFGTGNQAGTCTWNFYGDNAPAAITGSSVAAGTVTTALASAVAPNFQGYIIAVCSFQYGHGFAFVSDIGARNIAMGYLALIIPTPRASSDMLDN